MKARDYQEWAIASIFSYFEGKCGNPLIAMPTGTGKAFILNEFIKRAITRYPGTRIIQATHVDILIEQNFKSFLSLWPMAPSGVYSAGLKRREMGWPITFAGIQSVYQRAEEFGHTDLFLVDEAHLPSTKKDAMYQRFIRDLKQINPLLKVIGFTATHYRMGQGLLTEPGGIFTDICFDMTQLEAFNWFISQGWLIPLIPRRTKTEFDLEHVKIQNGEYSLSDLQKTVDREAITFEILKEMIELGENRKHWLIFGSGVDHVEHITTMLESLNIPATMVHHRMNAEVRKKNIDDFKSGRVRAMVNNGILTTGFDFPGLDLIGMLRATRSTGLWVQMLGRGTRPNCNSHMPLETVAQRLEAIRESDKQNCLVLDFAGNTKRLGPINDPVIPRPKGSKGGGVPPVKICEKCGVYNHAALRFCFSCGEEFPRIVRIALGASTEELIADKIPPPIIQEVFKVHNVNYSKHEREGHTPSVKVTYYCGLRMFKEWVCFDHEGYARRRARLWWRIAQKDKTAEAPSSVDEALHRIEELRIPFQITVRLDTKHPEVLSHAYPEPV